MDTVTSEWMVRDGTGKELKPADYLAAFAQFVKDNPAQIEAIRILLDRPRDWSTVALKELREKLRKSPGAVHARPACRRPTPSPAARRWWTSSPWSSTRPRRSSRC